MKIHEILLVIAGIAFLISNVSQRMLLDHIWSKDRAWASSEGLPVGGLTPYGFREVGRLYAKIITLHPKLRRDTYSSILTYICWIGTIPAILLAIAGVCFIQ